MDDQIEQALAVAPPWYLNQWIADLSRQNQTQNQQQKQNQKQNLNQIQSQNQTQNQHQKQNLNQIQGQSQEIPTKGVFSVGANEGTSFLDGTVNIGRTGTNNFIYCPKMLNNTGAIIEHGCAISENFFVHGLNGDIDKLQTSQLKTANGASSDAVMTTLGETNVSVRFSRMNLIFSGRAIVLKNLSLPIILGMNFLKNNSLSPYLTPYEAKLVHIPSNQSQALIANIVENIPGKAPPISV